MNFCSDDKHYILWVRSHCPWCTKAVDALSENALSYTVFDLDEKPEILSEVKDNLTWKTVPIILEIKENGETKLIGGFTDLEQYLKEEQNDSL